MEINIQNRGPAALLESFSGQITSGPWNPESTFHQMFKGFEHQRELGHQTSDWAAFKNVIASSENAKLQNQNGETPVGILKAFINQYGQGEDQSFKNSLRLFKEVNLDAHSEAGSADIVRLKNNQNNPGTQVLDEPKEKIKNLSELNAWLETVAVNKKDNLSEDDLEKVLKYLDRYCQLSENAPEYMKRGDNLGGITSDSRISTLDPALLDIIQNASTETRTDQVKKWLAKNGDFADKNQGQMTSALAANVRRFLEKEIPTELSGNQKAGPVYAGNVSAKENTTKGNDNNIYATKHLPGQKVQGGDNLSVNMEKGEKPIDTNMSSDGLKQKQDSSEGKNAYLKNPPLSQGESNSSGNSLSAHSFTEEGQHRPTFEKAQLAGNNQAIKGADTKPSGPINSMGTAQKQDGVDDKSGYVIYSGMGKTNTGNSSNTNGNHIEPSASPQKTEKTAQTHANAEFSQDKKGNENAGKERQAALNPQNNSNHNEKINSDPNFMNKSIEEGKATNDPVKNAKDFSDKFERMNGSNISYKEENINPSLNQNLSENKTADLLKSETGNEAGHKTEPNSSPARTDKANSNLFQGNPGEKAASEKTVMNQIVNRAVLELGKNKSELKIDIKPDNLGSIKIQVISENQQVVARISAQNIMVKEMIEHNIDQLKADLNKSGLEIDSVDVFVGQEENSGKSGAKEEFAKQVRNRSKFANSGLNGKESDSRNTLNRSSYSQDTAVDYYA